MRDLSVAAITTLSYFGQFWSMTADGVENFEIAGVHRPPLQLNSAFPFPPGSILKETEAPS
jgi:hypothetical protein